MKLSLQRSVDELPRIVQETERFFSSENLPAELRNVVDLSVEELFVNMVKYNSSAEQITLEMKFLDDSAADGIEVSLTDYDVDRFDPTAAGTVDTSAPAEDRTPGGLGVFLVMQMTDSVQYEYRNRTSRITFKKWVDESGN